MGQNPIPLVNIKIAGKWMFIPLKMVLIGIDPYPFVGMRRNHLFVFSWRRLLCDHVLARETGHVIYQWSSLGPYEIQ